MSIITVSCFALCCPQMVYRIANSLGVASSARMSQPKKLYTAEWILRAWLCAVSWWGFWLVGREGSCQLHSIRVSTAVTRQLSLRLSLESISWLSRKYKNMGYFLGGLPSKPLFSPTILYKFSQGCTQTFPRHWTDKSRRRCPF
jgi:hypothetical protein